VLSKIGVSNVLHPASKHPKVDPLISTIELADAGPATTSAQASVSMQMWRRREDHARDRPSIVGSEEGAYDMRAITAVSQPGHPTRRPSAQNAYATKTYPPITYSSVARRLRARRFCSGTSVGRLTAAFIELRVVAQHEARAECRSDHTTNRVAIPRKRKNPIASVMKVNSTLEPCAGSRPAA
jgi:hypothetical protein